MLDDEEMQRLMDDIAAPEALAGEEYSEAWAPDTIKGDEREANDTEGREIENSGGGKIFTGMSQTALMDKRKREEAIKQAKTLEEKEQIRRDQKFYRVSLLFSDGEAELVKSILGNKPAEKLLEMCKKETVPSS